MNKYVVIYDKPKTAAGAPTSPAGPASSRPAPPVTR
jgi:hypothetical protein